MTRTEREISEYQRIHEFNTMISRACKHHGAMAEIARYLKVSSPRVAQRKWKAERRSPLEKYCAEIPGAGLSQKELKKLLGYVVAITNHFSSDAARDS